MENDGVMLFLGVAWLVLGIAFLASEGRTRDWVENSPKGWLWRNHVGVERSVGIIRFGFGPVMTLLGLGTLLSLGLQYLA